MVFVHKYAKKGDRISLLCHDAASVSLSDLICALLPQSLLVKTDTSLVKAASAGFQMPPKPSLAITKETGF